jgi:hypothetical protein
MAGAASGLYPPNWTEINRVGSSGAATASVDHERSGV